ncbi:hypothetical protein CK203_110717 [Vitis vinifera]|uniref:Uncharacterized protein n=1 Tax=Vitis vinifera TaxID=29760 RepID=A0A438CDY6_VITVI|nr:hypothetical protein CK203_110717 [Vitis vinifera]
MRAPLDAPPHLLDSAPQRKYHTRRAACHACGPYSVLARSLPTKKAKTSEPGESSRVARDSQSQPPPTRHPILTSSPIEGNSDCRARAFHDEAYFDHHVLRQQPELGDSYRLLERLLLVYDYSWRPDTRLDSFYIDGRQGILGARQIAEAFHIPYAPADPVAFRWWAPLYEWDMVSILSRGTSSDPHSKTRRHCREIFSLDQWNHVLYHQHSPELPEPREVPPHPLPSIFAPSTSAPSEPVPEAASSDTPPTVPPTPEPPITIPGAEYCDLLASFQTLTTTQTAIMKWMDHL